MNKCLIFNISGASILGRPLGIYRIAHVLRENGWDSEVIHHVNYWTLEELQELAKSRITSDTIFVGFSQMFASPISPTMIIFIDWLRKTYPNSTLILGAGGTVWNSNIKYFDVYIKGFGEIALLEFLKWKTGNGPKPIFDLPMDSSNRCKVLDANKNYPAFPLSSLMVKYEDRDFLDPEEFLGVEFARGCKFECDFCNFPILGVKGDYSRSAEDFYEQMMDAYNRYGIKNYFVADETFNDRTEKITKFADVVERLPFTPWFNGFIRADLMVKRPLDKIELARMNFLGHHYGVETFNKKAGKSIKKGMDPLKLQQGLIESKNYFHNTGRKLYRGTMSLIIGLPGETVESLQHTKNWLLENWKGESFLPYCMEIPIGQHDKASLISGNYEKYGYRKMSKERQNEYKMQKSRETPHYNITVAAECLPWENDHLNVFQATDITADFWNMYTDPKNGFSIDMWRLSRHDYKGSVEDKLKIPITRLPMMEYTFPTAGSHIENVIKIYKHKKLSL